jgi:hypothetical protein
MGIIVMMDLGGVNAPTNVGGYVPRGALRAIHAAPSDPGTENDPAEQTLCGLPTAPMESHTYQPKRPGDSWYPTNLPESTRSASTARERFAASESGAQVPWARSLLRQAHPEMCPTADRLLGHVKGWGGVTARSAPRHCTPACDRPMTAGASPLDRARREEAFTQTGPM